MKTINQSYGNAVQLVKFTETAFYNCGRLTGLFAAAERPVFSCRLAAFINALSLGLVQLLKRKNARSCAQQGGQLEHVVRLLRDNSVIDSASGNST